MSHNSSTVVAGVDGSETAMRAARWAGAVAESLECSLRLVHSMATAPHAIADAAVIAIRAAATEAQRDAAEKVLTAAEHAVHAGHPSVPITTEAVADAVDEALVKYSQESRLVVVGCTDVSPTAALLMGSTTLTVATHAGCPVVAWRGHVDEPTTAPVVVGVDGSDGGATALAAAFEFADKFKVPLRAVRAWATPPTSDGVTIPYLIDAEAVEAAQRAQLIEVVDCMKKHYPDVSVQCFVERAKPGHALLKHLGDAQLVIVGSRGHHRLSSVVLGSTGLNLLHHSRVPVMICHRPDSR